MLRENQLNSELDTTRQGYETQIRNQDSSIQQLRESASHYDDRERLLKEQVAAILTRRVATVGARQHACIIQPGLTI